MLVLGGCQIFRMEDEVLVPTLGSVVRVDLTSHNDEGIVTERVSTIGTVTRRAGERWTVRDAHDGSEAEFRLPADRWQRASPGTDAFLTPSEHVGPAEFYVHLQRFASLAVQGVIVGRDHGA
jgi:hypothetical protein